MVVNKSTPTIFPFDIVAEELLSAITDAAQRYPPPLVPVVVVVKAIVNEV